MADSKVSKTKTKTKKTVTKNSTAKKEVDIIRFQLAEDKLMWNSPSNSIRLNAFLQETGGEVNSKKSPEDYEAVLTALKYGILTRVEEGEEFIKFKSKDITAGNKDIFKEASEKKIYKTQELLNMRTEQILPEIAKIKDPNFLIRLKQDEKKGLNETKVPRKVIEDAIQEKLDKLSINGMFPYDGDY